MRLFSTDLGLGYFAEFTKQSIKTHFDWEDETVEKTRPSVGIGLSF